jgi:F-type H+-transporting ATPase subunit delta
MERAAAIRYAKALFPLAKEADHTAQIGAEIEALSALLGENQELRNVLMQPLHPAAQRSAVLAAVAQQLGAGPILQNFYAFLIDQRRLVDFDGIAAEYRRLADEAAGLVPALVRSASPIDAARHERLEQALSRQVGRQVQLQVEIDPDLLGGVVAQVGDTVYDGSLKTQLQQLRASLVRG